jgi:hypothetical protein
VWSNSLWRVPSEHQQQQPQSGSTIVVDNTSGTIVSCRVGQRRENAKEMADNYWLVENNYNRKSSCTFHDLGYVACLSPGLIDVHTHISALGRVWEGYIRKCHTGCLCGRYPYYNVHRHATQFGARHNETVASFEREREQGDQSVLYADVGL